MTKRNEKTSPRVAKIAGEILNSLAHITNDSVACKCEIHKACRSLGVSVSDLKALAASCLTQAADKKKGKA